MFPYPGEQQLRNLIEARLDQVLPASEEPPTRLHEAMRYSVLGGGKRFRALVCIASSVATGGSVDQALDPACAAELVHCFSLVHDDLPSMDDDALRRGKPACHRVFGEGLALLAGDALFALAFEVLARMVAPPSVTTRCLQWLSEASGTKGMVGGQTMDIEAENSALDPSDLRGIHERKTGALVGASCAMGGACAGAAEEQQRALFEFGQLVGLAFQIWDDVLDEEGDASMMGKNAMSDRTKMKATYVSILGLEEARGEAERILDLAMKVAEPFGEKAEPLRNFAKRAIRREC